MTAKTIPKQDALDLCAIAKTVAEADWQQGASQGSLKMTMGVICAPPRRGLLVEIYVKRGHKVSRSTMNFGLWDTSSGVWERIYQLTIADSNIPTHSEKGVTWFGSHEHTGSTATQLSHLDQISFDDALQLFCQTVSLTIEFPIDDPLTFKLTPT